MQLLHDAHLLLLVFPFLLVGAAFLARTPVGWPVASWLSGLNLLLAMALTIGVFGFDGLGHTAGFSPLLTATPLATIILLLVSFIGWIIVRYSRRYMDGEIAANHYLRWLLLTLAAVNLVVMSNHLLVLLFGWIGISLGLHRLLTFYPERPRAVLAAHKKFLLARLAELSLLSAIALLYLQHQTFSIDQILAAYPVETLSWKEQLAALLLAVTALIKCAQLPVHGWLIQVVEAPTPVSALLHAGIINLGGFVLLLFAPLLAQATASQWLILVVAGLTTVLASLIMMTRISIKVRLAWSTSAQMGLMLVECALGLYELALLHLVAHSCYKAYAFLSAGNTVNLYRLSRHSQASKPDVHHWGIAAACAGLITLSAFALFHALSESHSWFSPWLLLFGMLTVLLAEKQERQLTAHLTTTLGLGVLLSLAYVLQKSGISLLIPAQTMSSGILADLWFVLLIGGLFGGYYLLQHSRVTAARERFRIALFAGLYLDEWFTRTTLRVWPARMPPRTHGKQLLNHPREDMV